MKFLNPDELAKRIYLDYKGKKFDAYKFRISNSPSIRVSKEGVVRNCTCLYHSLKPVKKPCRFTDAFKIYEKRNINQKPAVQD